MCVPSASGPCSCSHVKARRTKPGPSSWFQHRPFNALGRTGLKPWWLTENNVVQRSGGYWNQDSGAIDKVVSELLAGLAAQEARSVLSRLAEKLAGLRASDAQPRAILSRRQRPRRPGWVLDAVREVMADQVGPMRVAQVHAAVEALLGEAVSKDSVSWCLSAGAHKKERLFVRIARGRYVLARDARHAEGTGAKNAVVRGAAYGARLCPSSIPGRATPMDGRWCST
jgi:hypothetical protein